MWLITKEGFYSIVRKPGEDRLTVRSRARADLDRLRDGHLPELGPTTEREGTDYPYRARVAAPALGRALAALTEDISYSNFKSAVAAERGSARAQVYGEVWGALQSITAQEHRQRLPDADAYGGVVLDGRDRVLLREPTGHYGGYVWTFAKGRPARGETPEVTAVREVREETGVEARIVRLIPGNFAGDTSTTAFYLMRAAVDHGDFDPRETAQVRWVTPDEAQDMVRKTTSQRGRQRDLAVLEAALAAMRDKESMS